MAKGAQIQTDRTELLRLLEGLEYYRSWIIAGLERANGGVTQDDLNRIVEPGAVFLDVFETTDGRGRASVIKDVQAWYAHTASDLSYMLNAGDAALAAEVKQFLERFRKEVGFDFYAEAGLLRKMANTALKSRKIAQQDVYDALKELENDLSQSVLRPEELADVSALLRDFEGRVNLSPNLR